jgi:hypothetical protein
MCNGYAIKMQVQVIYNAAISSFTAHMYCKLEQTREINGYS